MNLAPMNAAPLDGYYAPMAILRGLLNQQQSLSGLARWGLLCSTQPLTQVSTLSGTVQLTQNIMSGASLTVRQTLRGNAGEFSYVSPLIGSKLARAIQLQVRR